MDLWSRVVWPVLAGTLVAVGVCGAAAVHGVALTVITAAMFWCLVAVCVYAAFGDDHVRPGRAARIGAWAAFALVVLMGLGLLHAPIGWGAAAAALLTSPPALARAAAWWGARHGSGQCAFVDADRLGEAEVARRFDAIVARLGPDAPTEWNE